MRHRESPIQEELLLLCISCSQYKGARFVQTPAIRARLCALPAAITAVTQLRGIQAFHWALSRSSSSGWALSAQRTYWSQTRSRSKPHTHRARICAFALWVQRTWQKLNDKETRREQRPDHTARTHTHTHTLTVPGLEINVGGERVSGAHVYLRCSCKSARHQPVNRPTERSLRR